MNYETLKSSEASMFSNIIFKEICQIVWDEFKYFLKLRQVQLGLEKLGSVGGCLQSNGTFKTECWGGWDLTESTF